jgi:hypothetical protein
MTMKRRSRLDYASDARRELKQCRLFLRFYSRPLAIYGDISFTLDDPAPESQSPQDIRGHTPSPAE